MATVPPQDSAETTVDDLSRISRTIPRYFRVLIADFLLAFSELEGAIEEVIWEYTNIEHK